MQTLWEIITKTLRYLSEILWMDIFLPYVGAIWNNFRAEEASASYLSSFTQISQQLYALVISLVISRNYFVTDILQAPWFLVGFFFFFSSQCKTSRQFIFDRLFINYTLLLFAGWNFFPHRFHFIIRLFNSAHIKMSS